MGSSKVSRFGWVGFLFVILFGLAGVSLAQTDESAVSDTAGAVDEMPAISMGGDEISVDDAENDAELGVPADSASNREEMLKLRKENPGKFKERWQAKQEKIKSRLEELKQTDPEKYERVLHRLKEKRQAMKDKFRDRKEDMRSEE